MVRRYETPEAFKQALEHRLRKRAVREGLVRLRQLLVFDRFLARAVEVFGDAMVLKGGLVVELRLERARTTKDLDLRLVGNPDVLSRLRQAARLDLGDFLVFEVQSDPRHPEIEAEGMRYQGQRFRAEARLAGKPYGSPFGIDVAFADPILGEPELITGESWLAFAGIEPTTVRVYPLETHVAEKLHAYTLPRERPNSRVKDLPDMALLASAREIEATAIRAAIERTFNHRATHPVPGRLPDPPVAWGPVYERMADVDGLRWRNLDDLTEAVRDFLDPVLGDESRTWIPRDWLWAGGQR